MDDNVLGGMLVRHLFLIMLMLGATSAQAFELIPPDQAGFLPERLQRVDQVFEEAVDKGQVAGGVVLITRHGQMAYHKTFGLADIASKKPMEHNAIFRIASMTKAVTTVAVMQLHEQGRFQLYDPVSKYIPEFKNPTVATFDETGTLIDTKPADKEITINHLLSHTSGISYPFIPSPLQTIYVNAGVIDGLTEKPVRLEEQMKLLAKQPLLFNPGERFHYGLNTDLLGYLIEVVSGKSLADYFEDKIFSPLNMHDTGFYLDDSREDRLVTLYAEVDGKLVVSDGTEADIKLDNPRYPAEGTKTYYSGGAGLSSTAMDYARFLQMLLNDGRLDGRRLLSRKSVEFMRTPWVDWDNDEQPDFGAGFQVTDNVGRAAQLGTPGTYAWGGAFNTTYMIDPEEELVALFMTQVRPYTNDLRGLFKTAVYQALE
ncbi:MAG: serine hydrolase domain-containing protein [Pseudomonadota bacterium]